MLRILCRLLPLLGLLLPLSGCMSCRAAKNGNACAPNLSEKSFRPMERGDAESGLHDLTVPGTVAELNQREPSAPHYRGLAPRECQCRASAASSVANLLDQERQAVTEHLAWCPKSKRLADMKDAILLHAALEARNQSAGSALEVYYRLAEAEARWQLLQESFFALDSALAKTRDLMAQGFKVRLDVDDLQRQRLATQAESTQLQLGILQLNDELRRLLGVDDCRDDWRFWPTLEGEESLARWALDEEVRQGLAHRPQLQLLRTLPARLDARTLPAAQMLLRSFNGLLGMSEPTAQRPRLGLLLAFMSAAGGVELDKSRQQLRHYRDEREREVARDIRQAVRAVHAGIDLVVLARERVRIRRDKFDDLRAKEDKGLTAFAEITQAHLDWLKARDEAIKETASLKIAQAKLKQEQGLLAAECGCGADDGGTTSDDASDDAEKHTKDAVDSDS